MRLIRFAAVALMIGLFFLAAACSGIVPSGTAAQGRVTEQPVIAPTDTAQDTAAATQTPAASAAPAAHTVYSDGISIDGISLNGLTMADARELITANQQPQLNAVGVTLELGSQVWKYSAGDVSCSFNTDTVLRNAWLISERNYMSEQKDSRFIPAPIKLATTLTIDPSPIEEQVMNLAYSLYVPFVDSTFAGYDPTKPDGKRLSFTLEQPGKQVDAAALWAAVQKEFADRTYGTVQITYTPVPAKITQQQWMSNMSLISRFSTNQSSTPARFNNIKVACSQITGHFIMPGDVFSFNDTTGPRTADKGYQMAHVINGGVIDNGMAGGTCQASGTLFNAAVCADLTVVERRHHTLKSTYLPLGLDATVDYGHYDLKLQNDSDSPVLIIMYLGTGKNKMKVYAEIYGKPLPGGESIDFSSTITQTIPAPTTVSFATSDAVQPGTTEIVQPHDGWKVTAYKQYKKGGKLIKSVALYTDYYKEAGTILVYNPADPKPTIPPQLLPSASPTPTPTPSPKPSPSPTPKQH